MATFADDQEELWVKCPFNPIHRVACRRYVFHLNKCPQREESEFLVCPYNSEHRVKAVELERHIQECRNSRSLYRQANQRSRLHRETGRNWTYEPPIAAEPEVGDTGKEYKADDGRAPVQISGLQKKLTVDEIFSHYKEDGKNPSALEIQALSKSERKLLHKMMLSEAKKKNAEASIASIENFELSNSCSTSSVSDGEPSHSLYTLPESECESLTSILNSVSLDSDVENDYLPLRRPFPGIGRGRDKS